MKKSRLKSLVLGIWKLNAVLLCGYLAVLGSHQNIFSSILDYRNVKSDPFDGMVYPIAYVPNWLKAGVWTPQTNFSDIDSRDLVPIPEYNLALLQNTDDRNTAALFERYTYMTAYMGAYLDNDRKEYVGSHCAVDIRAAMDTPVRAVANGVVVSTRDDAGGDGKYVIIRHDGVPYNGQLSQMYSIYMHLDQVSVQEGVKIAKGAVLGKVGMTGFTTTPHLHFQMDRANAPFSPYWPYTLSEAKAAGYDLYSAVNAGLGMQGALAYTYHPMEVVNQNLGTVFPQLANATVTTPVTTASTVSQPAAATGTAAVATTATNNAAVAAATTQKNSALLSAASMFGEATSSMPVVTTVSTPASTPQVLNTVTDKTTPASVPDVRETADPLANATTVSPAQAVAAPVVSTPAAVPQVSSATSAVASAASELFASAPEHAPVSSLRLAQQFGTAAGTAKVQIRTLDYAGNNTSSPVFGDLTVSLMRDGSPVASVAVGSDSFNNRVATVSVKYAGAAPQGIKVEGAGLLASASLTGLADTSSSTSVVQASAVLPATPSTTPHFADVPKSSIYFPAVQALADMGVVHGVSKNKFSPSGTLTRAEALVIVMRALEIEVDPNAKSTFSDIPANHWVQPYAAKAVEMGALNPTRSTFGTNQPTTRAEVASLLVVLGKIPASTLNVVKANDVSKNAWYASFVQTALDYGVMKAFNGKFKPETSVRRGDATVAVWNFLKKFRASGNQVG